MAQTLGNGQVFSGYRIEGLLGAGDTGEVYLAQDRDAARFVALKVLHAGAASSEGAQRRFLYAADAVSRLAYPNVVTICARGHEDGRPWIAMQYVQGADAGTMLRSGPMHPEHAVGIVTEVAEALDFAHRSGVLHLNVKPSNLLLAEGVPHPVLSDFLPAGPVGAERGYESLQYVAPEQIHGQIPTDQRADVYALGATLFHLLTGSQPYPGIPPQQLVQAHHTVPVPMASQMNPQLPSGIDGVLARALAKNPQERFGSCGEFAAAVQSVLGIYPGPAGQVQPAGTKRRRWPAAVGAVVAVLLVLGAGSAAGYFFYQQEADDDAQNKAEAARDAGCQWVHTLWTYDHNNFSAQRKKVLAGSMGELKKDMDSSMSKVEGIVVSDHIRSEVNQTLCFATTAGSDQVDVAALVNQSITRDNRTTPKTTQESYLLSMKLVNGRWLVAKADALLPTE